MDTFLNVGLTIFFISLISWIMWHYFDKPPKALYVSIIVVGAAVVVIANSAYLGDLRPLYEGIGAIVFSYLGGRFGYRVGFRNGFSFAGSVIGKGDAAGSDAAL